MSLLRGENQGITRVCLTGEESGQTDSEFKPVYRFKGTNNWIIRVYTHCQFVSRINTGINFEQNYKLLLVINHCRDSCVKPSSRIRISQARPILGERRAKIIRGGISRTIFAARISSLINYKLAGYLSRNFRRVRCFHAAP